MPGKIQRGIPELSQVGVSRMEITGGNYLIEQFVGQRFAGLVMLGEKIQGFFLQ
jgi:hypothetical protein